MNTAQPIRSQEDLKNFMGYYKKVKKNPRNQLLIVMGLNTALRISDLLSLKWKDVYEKDTDTLASHISLVEEKTKKPSCIYVNESIQTALREYLFFITNREKRQIENEEYLFKGKENTAISRVQAYRIIRKAAQYYGLSGVISPHSLRKTFGYHAWKNGISPVVLMEIYHHSSYAITKRYLGIEQDDRDEVFKKICL